MFELSYLVYAAFAFAALGYLARDELYIRALLLVSSAFWLAYYFTIAERPLWDAIVSSGTLALVNSVMIAVVIVERTTLGMQPDMRALYRTFPFLNPGQFRRLMRLGTRARAEAPVLLTTKGAAPDKLAYVVSGPIEIETEGGPIRIREGIFIGEIAFMTGGTASATVRLLPGADYIVWDRARLASVIRRRPNFRQALVAEFNRDLSGKLARSRPTAAAE